MIRPLLFFVFRIETLNSLVVDRCTYITTVFVRCTVLATGRTWPSADNRVIPINYQSVSSTSALSTGHCDVMRFSVHALAMSDRPFL